MWQLYYSKSAGCCVLTEGNIEALRGAASSGAIRESVKLLYTDPTPGVLCYWMANEHLARRDLSYAMKRARSGGYTGPKAREVLTQGLSRLVWFCLMLLEAPGVMPQACPDDDPDLAAYGEPFDLGEILELARPTNSYPNGFP